MSVSRKRALSLDTDPPDGKVLARVVGMSCDRETPGLEFLCLQT